MTPEKSSDTIIIFSHEVLDSCRNFTPLEIEVLERINRRVAGAGTLEETIDFLFNETRKIMSCDRIDVALTEDDNRRMVLHHVKTGYERVFLAKGYTTDIVGGSIQRVFNYGFPSVIQDMEEHSRKNPHSESARLLVNEGIRSSMVCPLVVDDRAVGMLMCRSKNINAYTSHEVCLNREFAERLSQAVEKAWHIERLSSAMNSYMEMLSFVSHELKSPLSSIIMLGNTLTTGYLGDMADRQKEMVQRMVTKAEYLLSLTGEYLNLANFETGEFRLNAREVDFIKDVVSHSLEIVAVTIDDARMTLEQNFDITADPVLCDPDLLKIVFTNLLSNAVKYGEKGGLLKLNVTSSDGIIHVSVWNQGPGFPENEKSRLFRRFSRIPTPELIERKGHGVGLYVTWKIIQLHGGRIWADSKHGEWAEFSFEIPSMMDRCVLP
jgi:hypothetical protein